MCSLLNSARSPLPETDPKLDVPPVVVSVAGAVAAVPALPDQEPDKQTLDTLPGGTRGVRLLITVQAVAAPSELCGHIPLVAHVLEAHGAPFKIQILLLVTQLLDRLSIFQTLYWTRHLKLNITLNV